MLLKGFAFSGYRSVGDNLVKLAPLKKINFIIGQNNIGKSNIVNFLYHQYPGFLRSLRGEVPREIKPLVGTDIHLSQHAVERRIAFEMPFSDVDNYIAKKNSW